MWAASLFILCAFGCGRGICSNDIGFLKPQSADKKHFLSDLKKQLQCIKTMMIHLYAGLGFKFGF